MFFFRHPKRVTDTKEVAVLVQQGTAPAIGVETVLLAKDTARAKADDGTGPELPGTSEDGAAAP